jgi:hypothetical protein
LRYGAGGGGGLRVKSKKPFVTEWVKRWHDKIIGSGNKRAFEKGSFLNRDTYLHSISNIVT